MVQMVPVVPVIRCSAGAPSARLTLSWHGERAEVRSSLTGCLGLVLVMVPERRPHGHVSEAGVVHIEEVGLVLHLRARTVRVICKAA